jgi:hypothetical protein
MPKRENVTWVAIHDKYPEHPKIAALSDAAFRCHVELICYSHRNLTDGRIPKAIWLRYRTKARTELIEADGVRPLPNGDVDVSDYLDMQLSAAEVKAARAKKAVAGVAGNHVRWHQRKGVTDPDCELCAVAQGIAPAIALSDRGSIADTEPEPDIPVVEVVMSSPQPGHGAA